MTAAQICRQIIYRGRCGKCSLVCRLVHVTRRQAQMQKHSRPFLVCARASVLCCALHRTIWCKHQMLQGRLEGNGMEWNGISVDATTTRYGNTAGLDAVHSSCSVLPRKSAYAISATPLQWPDTCHFDMRCTCLSTAAHSAHRTTYGMVLSSRRHSAASSPCSSVTFVRMRPTLTSSIAGSACEAASHLAAVRMIRWRSSRKCCVTTS